MAGAASLGSSLASMQLLDSVSAATTAMNAAAQSTKMITDTINGITSSFVDSATKAQNSMQQAGKAIQY
ncbi:ATP-dependent helicase HrpA [Erwinia psidii]|uniref:ATP-dependent helicase HrpA n=1 Tax=Erwinia psidii TaxID=69224 RepID=A0A3N6SEP1_9GAMM|nr:ATP-dependent helicase HrpA [Erwinia psidii]MCX8956575.1 ATP-dependent helicase HrpA [Erwinia psidii]MCX8961515.1 ATP-dependent helicase HrpA [Erwinia psidii]MCX8965017.1 ATP-dependent helicase HrpA [Erwinia psidii]RQM39910.1 ATP-dependent helicase HrpA [Erwinia psidii]